MRQRPYEKLIVWQEAHALCLRVYGMIGQFPTHERYALADQMRRSCYSVPTNIAEGNARRSKKEHRHFLEIAIGSLEELHYQIRLATNLSYITLQQQTELDDGIQKTGFLLQRLRTSLL